MREGDLVVARDEDTGVSGVFPITALMSRTSPGAIWLTLENAEGKASRMGVTSEHPLFVANKGWTVAGDVEVGDALRNMDLHELSVVAVEIDATPMRVHNLEVSGAHTFIAGELNVWTHNGIGYYYIRFKSGKIYIGKGCKKRMEDSAIERSDGGKDPAVVKRHFLGGATDDDSSYRREHRLMCLLGWKGKGTPGFKNVYSSPGRNK